MNKIVIGIPKDIDALNNVISYLNESHKWNKFDKRDWLLSDCNYLFWDKTKGEYGYTDYEQDGDSEFFERKNLTKVYWKDI